MNNALQTTVPWPQVIAVLAAMTGGIYSLAAFITLTIYVRLSHPRTHRLLIGIGSSTVTGILSLWVWANASSLSVYWSLSVWAGSLIELIGLSALIARDLHLSLKTLDAQ